MELKEGGSTEPNLFCGALLSWQLPSWLQALPYHLPRIGGFDNQEVRVLRIVDEQSGTEALARLAEYFIEMGQSKYAKNLKGELAKFPADLGARIAIARVESSIGDHKAFRISVEHLKSRMLQNGDRFLPWDRRVSLATVLAMANDYESCKTQVSRCITELSEERIRSLSPLSLRNLLSMSKGFHFTIQDARLSKLAHDLSQL